MEAELELHEYYQEKNVFWVPKQARWEFLKSSAALAIGTEIDLGNGETFKLTSVASCYRRLLEIGLNEYNVIPALVFVKMFPLKTLGQAAAVVLDADHPQGKLIPDVFHMYISEGGFSGLPLINGRMMAIFQFNDAPKNMKREDMEDKHRVFPGDGILPLPQILRDLKQTGFDGCISLELYNPEYYKRDLLEVAKTGLEKTLKVIDEAKVVK